MLHHRRKKRRRRYNNSSPISFFFLYQSWQENYLFLDNIRRISLVKWTGWGIHQDKWSYRCFYIVYTQTVYRRILKFFKQARNSRFWILIFFKWLFLWVSESVMFLKYQAKKLDLSFLWIVSVFIGLKCSVHTCTCTDDSCSYARCMDESWCSF